jgi:MerR family transcriptional regulator, redox-sensitive transcriptional activator SoxR
MSSATASLTIGQVAGRAGVRASRIRYYEQLGVLPEPSRHAGQRRYTEEVLHRLSIIDIAQRAGLTLDEIRDLTHPEHGDSAGEGLRKLADRKLPAIEALIERAQAVKRWLEIARSCECSTVDVCGLFVDPTLQPPPGDAKLSIHSVSPIR